MTSDGLAAALEELVLKVPEVGTGLQVHVSAGDRSWDVAVGSDGFGRAMRSDTLHHTYCLTKPVAGLAATDLILESGVEIDAPVASWCADAAVIAALPEGCSWRSLLAHRAGLREPSAARFRLVPSHGRNALVELAPPASGYAYSEVKGWWLIDRIMRGRSPAGSQWLETWLANSDLDFADEFVFSGAALRADPRLAPSVGRIGERVLPVLAEVTPPGLAALSVFHDGVCSARAAGSFLQSIGSRIRASRPDVVGWLLGVASDADAEWDPVLERETAFELGFMLGWESLGLARRGDALAIGHSAGFVNSFALALRDAPVAISFFANGACWDRAVQRYVRERVLDAVFALLDGHDGEFHYGASVVGSDAS